MTQDGKIIETVANKGLFVSTDEKGQSKSNNPCIPKSNNSWKYARTDGQLQT